MKIIFNKQKLIASIILVIATSLLVFGSFLYVFKSCRASCYESMKESAHMVDSRLVANVSNYLGVLENFSIMTNYYDDIKESSIINILPRVRVNTIASSVRLFLPDGFAVTEEGIFQDFSSILKYEDVYTPVKVITTVHKDYLRPNVDIIEHKVPIVKNGKTIGILSAVMDVKEMEEFIRVSSSRGKASVLIMDRRTKEIYINTDAERITDLRQISPDRIEKGNYLEDFIKSIDEQQHCYIAYKGLYGKNTKYLYAIPSSLEDMTVIVSMDSNIAFSSVNDIKHVMTILLIGVIVLFLMYIFWTFRVTKKQMSEESMEYSEIAKALSHSFDGIYYVNLDDNTYLEFTSQGDYASLPIDTSGNDFFADVYKNIKKVAYEEDISLLANFIKKDNLLADLVHGDVSSLPYRLKINGKIVYYRLKVIMPKTEANHIIVAAENIDSEVLRENEQKIQLEEALEKAESANKAKTIFLNNMSHDIRTPMNAIIGFNQLALAVKENPENTKNYLKKVDMASNHLLSLINDVLDMSRIESGKVVITENTENLKDMISYLIDIVMADINAKQQKLLVDTKGIVDEYVICDKLRLNQIFLNVISNAIKYTDVGGTISVSVNEVRKDFIGYNTYEFRIKDNGIGMSNKFLKTIFSPFTRERTSTISGVQGTGLGMCISKNLVEMMDGSINIDSTPGKGTEVIITLPFKVAENKSVAGDSDKEKQVSLVGMKILLVDDNDFNREITHIVLEQENVEVTEAFNGQEVYEKIKNSKPGDYDLILMDIQMPVMDGYTATREIRKLSQKELAEIPIIAMTANAFAEDRRNALAAGMNEHLAKPVDIEKLKSTIANFWNK